MAVPAGAMRIAVIASASGNGKTTLGRELARRLDVPFVELDSLVHGPGWVETPDAELRRQLEPVLAGPAWVIDGAYQHKLGNLVLDAADQVIWLDLPVHVWLPRLLRRTIRRIRHDEPLWNGNRESLSSAVWGRDSLIVYALRSHLRRRRTWPTELVGYHVLRVRRPEEVDQLLGGAYRQRRGPGGSKRPSD
jgi:adenylate kinase family enzyme